MIGMIHHCMPWIGNLWYALRKTYDALFALLSTICHRHISTNRVLHCWADGGFEKFKLHVCFIYRRSQNTQMAYLISRVPLYIDVHYHF